MIFQGKNLIYFFSCFIFFFAFTFSVQAEESPSYYDLSAEEITVKPSSPAVGQNCIITVKIKNNGTENLLSSSGLSGYGLDFENFSRQDLSYTYPSFDNIIEPGEYVYYTIGGSFNQSGSTDLSFAVNTDRELTENEVEAEGGYSNNEVNKTITVLSADSRDLKVKSIELSEERPVIGQDITITVKVENADEITLTDSTGLGELYIFYQFDDFNIDLNTTSHSSYPSMDNLFEGGEEFVYTYSGYFYKLGEKNLIFQVDRFDELSESDETNNASSTSVMVYETQADADDFSLLSYEMGFLSSTSIRVIWETDRETTGNVNYKKHDTYLFEEVNSSSAKTGHSVDVENLWPDINYDYRVVATNGTVEHDIAWQNFTTPKNDNLSLTSDAAKIVSGKQAKFSWATNLLSGGYVYYRKTGESEFLESGSSNLSLSHEVILQNLGDGDYEYYIKSTSEPGTVYQSETSTFTIASINQESQGDAQESGQEDSSVSGESSSDEASANNKNGLTVEAKITNSGLYKNLRGRIILRVEANGEAYYINPGSQNMYYLGRPDDAFSVMRSQGVGITNNNLLKIPVGLNNLTGQDSDGDGLPDLFEDAIGTNKNNKDSDGDGHEDKTEMGSGYNPSGSGKLNIDAGFANSQKGKIFLQVENNGEAWYINPSDGKRYFLGRPADAFSVMRNLGLGISNNNFDLL